VPKQLGTKEKERHEKILAKSGAAKINFLRASYNDLLQMP
jgi:hypothetical protein